MKDILQIILNSQNFMKLVYLAVGLTLLFVGLINKQEVVGLVKLAIQSCG